MTLSPPKPSRFFQQLGKMELEGSSAFLDAQQVYLRENKICGFVEIQITPASQVILLFAQGVLAGSYLLEDEDGKPFQLMNLSTVWDGKPTPIRTVEFPQIVGRMIWLALEAPISGGSEVAGKREFEKQLDTWKSEQFSGAVEIITEKAQGIFYTYEGNALDSESFFYNGQGFENTFDRHTMQEHEPVKIIVHKPSPASQSQQCLMLRQGILHWGNGILKRYQELVGQRLIKMTQKDIEDIAQPWGWNLFIENSRLRDEHFFAYAQTAAQAYRAIFMELGSQMDQVVGSALTHRILSETFEGLNKNTRIALELHRLIPAAFSE
jgi:hypothetical protein